MATPFRKNKGALSPGVGVISDFELKDIRKMTEKGKQKDGIIIDQGDLDVIRQRLIIKSKQDL